MVHIFLRVSTRALCALLLLATLAACASFSTKTAERDSRALAAPAIGAAAARDGASERAALLEKPLGADDAVALAMAFNPTLAASWTRLGIGAAEAFEASRLANPHLSFSRRAGDEGVVRTGALGIDLASLLLLPQGSRIAARDFAALKLEVAARAVEIARDTESAWYRCMAATQEAALSDALAEAAGVSAELAQAFYAAGNISRLELLREKALAGEAAVAAAQAGARLIRSRTRLNLLMGLRGADAVGWRMPAQSPLPVLEEPALAALLEDASANRLDLRAARLQLEILSDSQQSARSWRWLGGLELDYEWEREPDGSRLRGPGLTLELPIFQQGQARTLRADARLARGRAELAARELKVELNVREAHGLLLGLRTVIQNYAQTIVPAQGEAVERELERYNFMLIGAFDLLRAKQSEYQALSGYIEAIRDYWLARTALAYAVGSRLPGQASGQTEIELNGERKAEPSTHQHDHSKGEHP